MRIRWSSVLHQLESGRRRAVAACAAMVLVALVGVTHFSAKADDSGKPKAGAHRADTDVVELSDAQLGMISIGAVSERPFPIQTEAVGNIDFNEHMHAHVFPPYRGR